MKNAFILHATDNTSQGNWYPWVKQQLENSGYNVWSPDLPHAEKPSIRRYNTFLLGNKEWKFDKDTLIIGHSSGAVAILGLLQAFPEGTIVDTCVLVGSFKDNLDWDALNDLFVDPFDFDTIKKRAKRFIFIHSDNDPYCPLDHAKYLSQKLNGKLQIVPGQKHFSIGTMGETYKEFPLLLELIQQK